MIERWFQGESVCGALRERTQEPGKQLLHCLWTYGRAHEYDINALAGVIERLFPERACHCANGQQSPIIQVIHFNNHLDTTHDQVDKVLHTYEGERG